MRLRLARPALLSLALAGLATAEEPAVKVGGLIDLRYAHTDSQPSWLESG